MRSVRYLGALQRPCSVDAQPEQGQVSLTAAVRVPLTDVAPSEAWLMRIDAPMAQLRAPRRVVPTRFRSRSGRCTA